MVRRWAAPLGLGLALACATSEVPAYRVEAECRGGTADGAYQALGPGGDRIEGRYCGGERCGVFHFYSGPHVKVAELPYVGRQLEGVVRIYYLPHVAPESPHRRRVEGTFQDGRRHGAWYSWWPDGSLRTELAYRYGALSGALAWDPQGEPLPPGDAELVAQRDATADMRLLQALGAILTSNPPVCGDASRPAGARRVSPPGAAPVREPREAG